MPDPDLHESRIEGLLTPRRPEAARNGGENRAPTADVRNVRHIGHLAEEDAARCRNGLFNGLQRSTR
jgi:hypothetical protein